jgi:hypothetical protein
MPLSVSLEAHWHDGTLSCFVAVPTESSASLARKSELQLYFYGLPAFYTSLAYKNELEVYFYHVSTLFLPVPSPLYATASWWRIFIVFRRPLRLLCQAMSQNPSSNIFTTPHPAFASSCAATASATVSIRTAIATYSINTTTNSSTGF